MLVAEDGHLALEQLQHAPVNLILADIAMPEMNGYQLYKQVRANPTKPVQPEDLLATVEGRLRRARSIYRLSRAANAVPAPALATAEEAGTLLRPLIRTLRHRLGYAGLRVVDSGIGISAQHLPHITRTACRALAWAWRSPQELIHHHQGSLGVASTRGEGGTFAFYLPLVESG